MDATVVIIVLVIALPVLVIWALSKSAGMRGPLPPARQGREPVEMLVTEAVPEEHPDEDDFSPGPEYPPRDQDDESPGRRPEPFI